MAYVYGYDQTPHFDVDGGYGSWLSSAVKSVGHAVSAVAKPVASAVSAAVRPLDVTSNKSVLGKFAKTTVGKVVLLPLAAPAAAVKVSTWGLAQTGLKPFKQLESEAHRVVSKTPVKGLLETQAVVAAGTAAVALTVVSGGGAAGAIIAALPAAKLVATNKASYGGAVSAGISGAAAGLAVVGGQSLLSQATGALKSSSAPPAQSLPVVEPVTVSDAGLAAPPQPTGGSNVFGPAAGAGVGFLAGGPVGALLGAGAGFWLGRKKV